MGIKLFLACVAVLTVAWLTGLLALVWAIL